ncbi:hypothetical protein BDF14DRAFT_874949 [Spinellus fusiger]|nr:hypothetical protein BDF14DRAFT_874949 [Spinellus fusiger]
MNDVGQIMHALDKETVRALESGQVITDTEAIVKELVENSLDAHAKTINVKLLHHGLELIQTMVKGFQYKTDLIWPSATGPPNSLVLMAYKVFVLLGSEEKHCTLFVL